MSPLAACLPQKELWPERIFQGPALAYPARLNAAQALLDDNVREHAGRTAIVFEDQKVTYRELSAMVGRLGNALRRLGVGKGDRVMLRSFNTPAAVAAWLAIGRIGAINVATMPLLRHRELTYMANDAGCKAVICAAPLIEEVERCRGALPTVEHLLVQGGQPPAGYRSLDALAEAEATTCDPESTSRDDIALIGYTSGSTGEPKGCVSFQDDILAIADTYAKSILAPRPDDVFGGHPSLAFTFGLGALLIFPFRFGASTTLLERFTPQAMLETLARDRVTLAFCAPTCYRMMLDLDPERRFDLSALRYGVSAGETLPGKIFSRWKEERGVELLDGIGSTEMLHIFVSSRPGEGKPGVTGRVVPGYEAKIVDEDGHELPRGEPGLLAVRGPTGCRYWRKPDRQQAYVKDGWNYPGDVFIQDKDGSFRYLCRNDDLIVTAGYNVAGVEVENTLNEHPAVKESGVVGADDALRGKVVKAFVVLKDDGAASPALGEELKEFVKARLAPYKYPRQIEFVKNLPRTDTGKIQRFRLRSAVDKT